MSEILGKVSSIETLGLVDGPGVRFVVFLQGCKLRCQYCHNPETWDINGKAQIISAVDLVKKIQRYTNYYGVDGGVTFSGGEPLLQPKFLCECLKLCKNHNINTCLDTAGVGFGDYDEILKFVDLVILDVKAVDRDEYKFITGQDMKYFEKFLSDCVRLKKRLWIRQVIVPNINDDVEHVEKLNKFVENIPNVERVELLPYKTLGVHKYKDLNIAYRLDGVPDMDEEKLQILSSKLKKR